MTPQGVTQQLEQVLGRLIGANLSVKQFRPKVENLLGGAIRIGKLPLASLSLRDTPYETIYGELERSESYHVKLCDGGLIIFQYTFNKDGSLYKHRLCYFPSIVLPTIEESPQLYENDELYGDVISQRLVRFPIRFDFDPQNHVDVEHPKSHLTLGQFENCRIPVGGAVGPNAFVMFLLRNFYYRLYKKNKNRFEKKVHHLPGVDTITDAERRISHFLSGR
ncbi:DUF2290 domain-containing protein [Ralstonia sp.]|uniref:DUF2290 domain-containing protein n=1 Tax=Ralstonia sp. TaxID=54061 RepID=UPI002CEC4CD5|nr:DUF2290 domain-containing protein [Ralstonia sp.]HWV02965.1 DUF2290 domain-containing protein [Ralstonia sp.]